MPAGMLLGNSAISRIIGNAQLIDIYMVKTKTEEEKSAKEEHSNRDDVFHDVSG